MTDLLVFFDLALLACTVYRLMEQGADRAHAQLLQAINAYNHEVRLRRRSGGDAGQTGDPLPPRSPETGIEPPAPARAGSPGSLPPAIEGRTGSGTPAGTDVDADPPGRRSRACRTPAPVGGAVPRTVPPTGLQRVIVHG